MLDSIYHMTLYLVGCHGNMNLNNLFVNLIWC